jgi:tRNA(Phe) wybutosine-synthesizing methylase Tyw3
MFTPFCSADLSTVTLKDKRQLLATLKASIQQEVSLNKANRVSIKQQKIAAANSKRLEAIRKAEEKLARLKAKLAV